mmetsp:Transcript_17670/g.15586  ORF Transcript_17670/g.15586 Transcript_17670/m.15586 type:complete len:241 (+) Transcript_17670:609-1331(+)
MEGRPSLLNHAEDGHQRDMSKVFDALDLSVFDYSRIGNNPNKITNIKKLLPLKDEYPVLFGDKLLNNYRILEEKYINTHKDFKSYKNKYRILEEKHKLLNDNYGKLSKNYEKCYIQDNFEGKFSSRKVPYNIDGGGTGMPMYDCTKARSPHEYSPGMGIIKKKKQNAYDALNSIKKMSNMGVNENKSSNEEFNDISSIMFTPVALDNQQNLSSDDDFDNNENMLEDVINEDSNEERTRDL